jgi:NAD+ synthase (glutamine-hydrolysing)
MFGFVRCGAAVPELKVADCKYNTEKIIELINEAKKEKLALLVFPELSITSYTCADLFMQDKLIDESKKSLSEIMKATDGCNMLVFVGLPVVADCQAFDCAAVLQNGDILGLIPKTYVPNYSEFYEKRWFSPANGLIDKDIEICGKNVPIGTDIIFKAENIPELVVGVEICEDLWSPIPPSSYAALNGATVLVNLSASNELATKNEYRRHLVSQQSASTISAYVYSSAGVGESTQDLVFSGHALITENGTIFNESKRFSRKSQLIFSDIDVTRLVNDRKKNTTFMSHNLFYGSRLYRTVKFTAVEFKEKWVQRPNICMPFVPKNDEKLAERCFDIFRIQVSGLAKRVSHTHSKSLIVGISGGLDSTLALLVVVKACDYLNIDRKAVIGVTMPGFGTTDRTYNNAVSLMKSLGITTREISIKDAAILHFNDIDHDINVHDVTYENTQARERTQILMDIANQEQGMVIGTGDLSELALGWATYNGDHMSMYGVNSGVPKTLVRVLVKWVADNEEFDDTSKELLYDIIDTPVSPELLPPDKKGEIKQKTEDLIGPYELHDFFLYYIVRFGFSPKKIMYLAENAFNEKYSREELIKWLKNFYKRFFSQQFKRSCLPDGPKVGTINLSPRGDWRMPSDAVSRIWIDEIEKL